MFEFPLIRFDNRKWLEKLQEGDFYMRNCLYYQSLENDDEARNDPYDGSLPFADVNGVMKQLSGKETKNQRLMLLDLFVKCFYYCDEADFVSINESMRKLMFSEKTKRAIREFNVDSAMLIFSPTQFIKQIENVCSSMKEPIVYDKVDYLDEKGYQCKRERLIDQPDECVRFPFYKDSRFSDQKEFRICVKHPLIQADEQKPYLVLPKTIGNTPYSLDIGHIDDTCIVSIENLLRNGVIWDYNSQHYYVCEE